LYKNVAIIARYPNRFSLRPSTGRDNAVQVRSRSNLPQNEPLRWNVEVASREFRLAVNTLRKSLGQSGAEPDAGGCFTTGQIVAALFDDLRAEKLATQRQLTRRYELDNLITEGRVLDKAPLMAALSAIADAMVSRIMASGLSRNEKEDVLKELSSVPIALEEVTARQSRLPRRNGQKVIDEADEG
jgi:hypothetical protein